MTRIFAAVFVVTLLMFAGPVAPALAQSVVPVTVVVQPVAGIQIAPGASLHLTVPPATSTLPDDGVAFTIAGNASATVTATPDQFLFVNPYIVGATTQPGRYLGKAVHASGALIGYNLSLEFPVFVYHTLPGTNGQGASSSSVPVSSGPVQGFLHLFASHRWTPDATMPAVGDYHGNIVITVTASL